MVKKAARFTESREQDIQRDGQKIIFQKTSLRKAIRRNLHPPWIYDTKFVPTVQMSEIYQRRR